MDDEHYERMACRTLGIPHPDDTRIGVHHHLGTFTIAHSPEALRAVSIEYVAHEYLSDLLSFDGYLNAVSRQAALRHQVKQHRARFGQWVDKVMTHGSKASSPLLIQEEAENRFADLLEYARERFSANVKGYLHYLKIYGDNTKNEGTKEKAHNLADILTNPVEVYLKEDKQNPHSYVLGTTRSGKTELLKLMIHSVVARGRDASAVVLDPNGEFAQEVGRWKDFIGTNRLVYIEPNLYPGLTPVINPFEIWGVEATDMSPAAMDVKEIVAGQLVEALEMLISDQGQGGALTLPMRATLYPCVLALLNRPNSTLRDLQRFMEKDPDELVAFGASLTHPDLEEIREFFSAGMLDEVNKETKRSIQRKLFSLTQKRVFKNLTCGKSTFWLEEAVQKKQVVVFQLGKGSIHAETGRAFGRLVMAQLLSMAIRRVKLPKHQRTPCHLFVDECHNFVSETVGDILAEAGKFRLHLTLAQQAAGQKMSSELQKIVFMCATMQFSGGAPESASRDNAKLFGVSPGEISSLNIGEFVTRARRQTPVFRLQARGDLLGNANAMTNLTWRRMRARQLDAFYRPTIETPEPDDDNPPPMPAETSTGRRKRKPV